MNVNTFPIAKEFLLEECSELGQAPVILFMDNLKGIYFSHYFPQYIPGTHLFLEKNTWRKIFKMKEK